MCVVRVFVSVIMSLPHGVMGSSVIVAFPGHTHLYLGLVVTKPIFGVSDKMRFKPVASATETS